MNSLISVIVPVYNVEKYLHKCIDSILAQRYTDFELLLINDGSTDTSGNICDDYAQKDSRVKVFHKQNGGVSSARNFGLDNAQGEWIGFVDSDDWIESEMYNFLITKAQESNFDIVACNYNKVFDDIIIPRPAIEKSPLIRENEQIKWFILDALYPKYDLLINNITIEVRAIWHKIFRKDIIHKSHIRFNENMKISEDALFNLQCFQQAQSVAFFNEYLYNYRIIEQSATRGFDCHIDEQIIFNLTQFYNTIKEGLVDHDYQSVLVLRTLEYLKVLFQKNLFHPSNNMSFNEKKDTLAKVLKSETYISILNLKPSKLKLSFKQYIELFLLKNKLISIYYYLKKISHP
ncbi:MAG: glycosyltransferase [bacterium]